MSYSVTIAEVVNGISVTEPSYTVTIEEVVNGVTVTPPAANEISITNINYPITISYNGVIVENGGGLAGNGVPVGGTTGQVLKKSSNTNYDLVWANDTTGIIDIVQDLTPQLGGALDVNGQKIVSATNGNVIIDPDGSGNTQIQSDLFVGNGAADAVVGARGSQSLILLADALNLAGQAALNLNVSGTVIVSPGNNQIELQGNTVTLGDGAGAATVTTNGSQDLSLNNTAGANITLANAGALTISPVTGQSAILSGTAVNIGRRTVSSGTSSNAISAQRSHSSLTLNSMDGHIVGLAFSHRDSTTAASFFHRVGGKYSTSGSHSLVFDKSTDNFTSSVRQAEIADNKFILGPLSGSTAQTVTTALSQNLVLNTNNGTTTGNITITAGSNGNIGINPNGTGQIILQSNYTQVGRSGAGSSVITTYPNKDLTISTNEDSGTPKITMEWLNQKITLQDTLSNNKIELGGDPISSYGMVITAKDKFRVGNGISNLIDIDTLTSNGTTLLSATNVGPVTIQQGTDGLGAGLVLSNDVYIRGNNNTGIIVVGGNTNSNIEITPHGTGDVQLNTDTVRVGDANTAARITTNGTGTLTINTNSGTNSGSIIINQGANANIQITPNGTGSIVLDGLNWPQSDGVANYVLKTNGSGQLSWADANTLGLSIGITDIVQDTTPQLGGDLDTQGYKITTSQTNGDIKIDAVGTGKVKLNSIAYPNADGSAGQVLSTNGSGVTSWVNKQDPTLVNDSQPNIQSTGQHWYRPITGAFYTARNGNWEPVNDDGYF